MKCFGKIAVCLAGGLTLNAGLSGAGPASANNPSMANPSSASSPSASPYAAIAVRNIFGLNPPVVTTNDPNEQLLASLPKITPTGIMSIFGQSKVLFKVADAAAKARPPAKEEFYILSEGQRQDDIEVMSIDEENSLVTFDNHGFTQELPLANAPDAAAQASVSPGPRDPSMTTGRRGGRAGNVNPGGSSRLGARSGGHSGAARNGRPGFSGDDGNGVNNGMDAGSSTQRSINPQEASTLTPEEAQIILAAERLKAIQENNSTVPLYQPTAIDRAAGIPQGAGAGGGPPAP